MLAGSGAPGGSAGMPGFGDTRAGSTSGSATGATPIRPEGYVAGQPHDPSSQPQRASSADGEPGTPLRPGEWYPTQREPAVKVKPEPDDKKRKPGFKPAESRGRDWALRDGPRSAAAITRPIRVDCYPDRLVVLYEEGAAGGNVVNLNGSMANSIDAFISAVWEHMDTWGIAGRGMYWRPVLSVYVADGAEQRFNELTRLLEGSGLTVERRR
jgi:hypothetical protein